MDAFNKLWFFIRVLLNTQLAYAVIRGWCKQYCDEHWHDEYIDWTVSSTDDLCNMLGTSSYHNPFNIGLVKFLASKYEKVQLIDSVKNYEREFSSKEVEGLVREIKVVGNISKRESTSVVNTLLENKVTVGQLWNFCSAKFTNDNTLILDDSEPLLEFYYSVKVCTTQFSGSYRHIDIST